MYEVRRPLIGVSLVVSAGILWGKYSQPRDAGFLFFMLPIFALAWLCIGKYKSFFIFILLFGLGVLRVISSFPDGENQIPKNILDRQVHFRGRVLNEPYFYSFSDVGRGVWKFNAKIEDLHIDDRIYQLDQKFRVRLYGWYNDKLPVPWEWISLTGKMNTNRYYHGVDWEITVRSVDHVEREKNRTMWITMAEFFRIMRQKALNILSAESGRFDDHAGIQQAVMLGVREKVSEPMSNLFRDMGCMHVFAISGLHVGLLILVITLLLKAVGLSLNQMGWVLIPILLLFAYITGMRPSVWRASLMAIVYLIAPLIYAKPDMGNSVAFSALFLLLINPNQISEPSFVYSYLIVIFILLFYAKFKEKIHRFSGVKRYFVSLILTTLAATITSIPLTLYFFGSGTWIGLLSNLFVIPMLFLIVLASWLSLLLPALASIFNQSVYILIEIILIGLRGLSALPVTVWQADEVPAMALFAWYGSCAYLLLLARRRTDWIIGIMMAAGALIFIF